MRIATGDSFSKGEKPFLSSWTHWKMDVSYLKTYLSDVWFKDFSN
jgi:hypothetical protein